VTWASLDTGVQHLNVRCQTLIIAILVVLIHLLR
jgi:hypothetical protein